jgi:hypothetical protein
MRRPSPPSSSGLATALSAVVVEELLAREGELTRREEALIAREEKVRISEKALACPVSASLDEVRTKVEAARQEYLNKMAVHTARGRQVIDFDKMLGEKRARLDDQEWDLELHTATLAQGINP